MSRFLTRCYKYLRSEIRRPCWCVMYMGTYSRKTVFTLHGGSFVILAGAMKRIWRRRTSWLLVFQLHNPYDVAHLWPRTTVKTASMWAGGVKCRGNLKKPLVGSQVIDQLQKYRMLQRLSRSLIIFSIFITYWHDLLSWLPLSTNRTMFFNFFLLK